MSNTVVVKWQAEEVGKRAPDKLREQKNLKLKTRAQLNKRARAQKSKKALKSKYGQVEIQVKPVNRIHFRYEALDSREQRVARLWDRQPAPSPWPAS